MAFGGGKGPSTLNVEGSTVTAVIASEQPVLMPDYDRLEMIPETLLASGAQFPAQVPLLDSHQRSSARDVLGSVRMIRTEGKQLAARVEISSTAADVLKRIEEGHLTDLSVGYRINKKRFIPADKSEVIEGRTFSGPMNVITSWTIREVSVTPIGADDQAKFRGLDTSIKKGSTMTTTNTNDNTNASEVEQLRAEVAQLRQEKLHRYIDDNCAKYNLESFAPRLKRQCVEDWEAAREISRLREDQHVNIPHTIIDPGVSSADKLRGAMTDALTVRCLTGGGLDATRHLPENQRHAGYRDFQGASMLRMAEFILQANGVRTVAMSPAQIATAALTGEYGERAGLHYSASFPNLLLDASNKTLMSAYTETPSAAMMVARIAPSAADFKNLHRIRMGEIANLNIWPDNKKPEQLTTTDEKLTFGVEAYANEVSFSWRSLVNDDMDAFSRIPALMGAAASRTVNAAFWSTLIANPVMPYDSVALISDATGSRKQDNTTTGTLTVANVGTAKALMRRMTGINTRQGNKSPAILNIQPRYLVVPATLETTAGQIVNSTFDPKDNAPYGVFNPFTDLTVVVEPLLDDDSTAEWYLFAAQQNAPIEIVFLQGQKTPVTDSWVDPQDKSLHYNIVQSFAICPVDHRGLIYSTGS